MQAGSWLPQCALAKVAILRRVNGNEDLLSRLRRYVPSEIGSVVDSIAPAIEFSVGPELAAPRVDFGCFQP